MKTVRCLIFILCALFVTSIPTCADMLWEPWGDDAATEFFDSHYTTSDERTYLCDSYDGTVTAYATPEDLSVVQTFKNGETLTIYAIWNGKNLDWGLCYDSQNKKFGWIPMDELTLCYNAQSFREEYGDEIVDYDGSYENVTYGYVWTYPCSGKLSESNPVEIDSSEDSLLEYSGFLYTYVDADGEVWCYFSCEGPGSTFDYAGWMCVTDPLNAKIPAMEVTQAQSTSQQQGGDSISVSGEVKSTDSSVSDEVESTDSSSEASAPDAQSLILVTALVIAVAAVTVVLLVIFWNKEMYS